MAGIIDSLRGDHSRITKLLDALERQVDAFAEGGQIDFEIADGVLHYCRSHPDRYHHPREDLVYDRLMQRNPQAATAIGDLHREHAKIAELTETLARALDAVEQDVPMERTTFVAAARRFLAGYRHHILMEEKHFFPAAERNLTAADWRAIAQQQPAAADPVFEQRQDQRFNALFADVVAWDDQLPAGA